MDAKFLFEQDILEQSNPEFSILLENRIDFLKKQHPAHHDLIDYLSKEADPTPNKKYTEWLTQRAIKGDLPTTTAKIREGLEWFSKAKSSAHDTNIKNHSVQSMLDTAHVVKNTTDESVKPLEKIYDQDGVTAFKIPNKATSIKLYGPGAKHETTWCTAANSSNNRFDSTPGGKYTIHFPNGKFVQFNHESGQLKDGANRDISLGHPDYAPYYDHIKDIVTKTEPNDPDAVLKNWMFPTKGNRLFTHGKIDDTDFGVLVKDGSIRLKLARNPLLKPEHYETLAKDYMTHSYLSVNPSTPQHIIDKIDTNIIGAIENHRALSPRRVHELIDSASHFWKDQSSSNGNINDARFISDLAKNRNQHFDESHLEKLNNFPIKGSFAADTMMMLIGTHQRLLHKNVSTSFKRLHKLSDNGMKDAQLLSDFITHNDVSDEDMHDAVSSASHHTAFDLLAHPKVKQEHKDIILNNIRNGHAGRAQYEIDKPYIPHDMAQFHASHLHADSSVFELYTLRKDADINFIHHKIIKDGARLPHYHPFYQKKLPIEIGTHPLHLMNVANNINEQPQYNKDDLHKIIDALPETTELRTLRGIVEHPNSNPSHYQKIKDKFDIYHVRDMLVASKKVPDSMKELM